MFVKPKQIFILSILSILIFSQIVLAEDTNVKAFVDRTSISIEDTLTLTITINKGKPDVDTSAIKDFNIISHSTSSNISFVNGSLSNEFRHIYTLSPKKTGDLIIPSLIVSKSGKRYLTRQITIRVSKSDIKETSNSNIFAQANISSGIMYTGEQLIYTFSFFTNVRVGNLRFSKPSFSGFTAKSLGDEKQYTKIINGKEYSVSQLQYLLTPIDSGEISIEPSVLGCDVIIQAQSRNPAQSFDSFFNDSFFGRTRTKHKILKTAPKKVLVKELPPYNLSEPFTGIVGEITLKSEIDNTSIKAGDSATLKLIVEGHGNLMDAEAPELTAPEGFKLYKDKPESDIQTTAQGFYGKKIFKYVLVAVDPGEYNFGPMKFSYFNPKKGTYEILQSDKIKISVKPSDNQNVNSEEERHDVREPAKRIVKKRIKYTGHDILPLKEDINSIKDQKMLSLKTYLFLLTLPVLITILILILLKFIQKEKKKKSIMVKKIRALLSEASKNSVSSTDFLSCVYKVIVYSIGLNSESTSELLTINEAEALLKNNKQSSKINDDILKLLDKIESIRYSGMEPSQDEKKEILNQTKNAFRRLN